LIIINGKPKADQKLGLLSMITMSIYCLIRNIEIINDYKSTTLNFIQVQPGSLTVMTRKAPNETYLFVNLFLISIIKLKQPEMNKKITIRCVGT